MVLILLQAQEEFRAGCDSLTVQKLLETFIEAKSTGKEKPGTDIFLCISFVCKQDIICLKLAITELAIVLILQNKFNEHY